VRRLDRVHDEYEHAMSEYIGGLGKPNPGTFGQYSSRRGVLAVCAKTVNGDFGTEPPQYFRWGDFRAYLRRLCTGGAS
jgi:hypothetical protein